MRWRWWWITARRPCSSNFLNAHCSLPIVPQCPLNENKVVEPRKSAYCLIYIYIYMCTTKLLNSQISILHIYIYVYYKVVELANQHIASSTCVLHVYYKVVELANQHIASYTCVLQSCWTRKSAYVLCHNIYDYTYCSYASDLEQAAEALKCLEI